MADVVIEITPATWNMKPFGMARISDRFHIASERTLDNEGFNIPNYYLYCIALEIAFKAAILSKNNSEPNKRYVWKTIGHDLLLAYDGFIRATGSRPLSDADINCVKKINRFYKDRGGMKYFPPEILYELVTGTKGLPPLEDLRTVSRKINEVLVANDFYVEC